MAYWVVMLLGLVRSSVGATPRVADCPRAFVALAKLRLRPDC